MLVETEKVCVNLPAAESVVPAPPRPAPQVPQLEPAAVLDWVVARPCSYSPDAASLPTALLAGW